MIYYIELQSKNLSKNIFERRGGLSLCRNNYIFNGGNDMSTKKVCYFCQQNRNPNYKNVAEIKRFTYESGELKPAGLTGLCVKHQRRLAKERARAKLIALI